MALKRLSGPGTRPVQVKRVSAAVPAKAGKSSRKKTASASAGLASPVSRKSFRENAAKVRAAVEKAKATKAANMICGDKSRLVAEPQDQPAQAAIGKDKSRWQKAVGRAKAANHSNAEECAAREHIEQSSELASIEKSEPKPSGRIKRTAVDRLDDPPPATGMALIERVTQAVERELSQIEIIVGGNRVKPAQRTEAERRARTLASLARTLSEVRKLRADETKPKRDNDDDLPRDLDEFRRTLSRRLEQMVRARSDVPAGGDEPE